MDPFTLAALISGGMQLGGGVLSGIGQGKMNAKQAELAREQLALQSTQMDPLRQQRLRANFALMSAILPQMRNARLSTPAGYEAYRPQMSGGLNNLIPEGGFGSDVLNFFTPEARLGQEQTFYQNKNIPRPNPVQVGYPMEAGTRANTDLENLRGESASNVALQNAVGKKKKKGGNALLAGAAKVGNIPGMIVGGLKKLF